MSLSFLDSFTIMGENGTIKRTNYFFQFW